MKKYCGNNEVELQTGLREGKYMSLGSRSECLRIGYGKALYSPVNQEYRLPYSPIEEDRFYCGDQIRLPDGYSRFGTRPQCLSRGFGIGSSRKAKRITTSKKRKTKIKSRSGKRKSRVKSRSVRNRSKKTTRPLNGRSKSKKSRSKPKIRRKRRRV